VVELDQLIEEGALVAPHLDQIKTILEADIFEDEMGRQMREYMRENFRDIGDYSVVVAMLGATKIISAYNLRRVMQA
jgi:hypothetical protein